MRADRCPPVFSVVVATYGRSGQIAPTLRSIAQQSMTDFEVLVVSDGPAAPGLDEVVNAFDERFSLHVLGQRVGSQSGPNRLGIARAKGTYVAYLGHDDIWRSQHLELLHRVLTGHRDASFAVSGALVSGPVGSDTFWVTGLFDDTDVGNPRRLFYPPSSIAHLRVLPDRVPPWRDPATTSLPVDSVFMLGAYEAGCRFYSTHRITVAKFTSAMTYLSYLLPTTADQDLIAGLLEDDHRWDAYLDTGVRSARRNVRYLNLAHGRSAGPGDWHASLQRLRGLTMEPLTRICEPTWLPAGEDWRGFDWHAGEHRELHGHRNWRWSGPNPRPRLPLTVTCAGWARVEALVLAFAPGVRQSLDLLVEGQPVPFTLTDHRDGTTTLSFGTALRDDRPTILEFVMAATTIAPDVSASGGRTARALELIPARWRGRLERRALNASPGVRKLVRRVYMRTAGTMVSRPRMVGLALAGVMVTPSQGPER